MQPVAQLMRRLACRQLPEGRRSCPTRVYMPARPQAPLVDILQALRYLHSMQIVHGDLKAHNILIADSNGVTAKVADFGLSIKMDTEQTHVSGVHAGTLNHMAPEILMSGHISKAADVYAFGILMYETMTTLKAFRGIPMHLISNKICNARERPRFLPGCPQSVRFPGPRPCLQICLEPWCLGE